LHTLASNTRIYLKRPAAGRDASKMPKGDNYHAGRAMSVERTETLPVRTPTDVVIVRQIVKRWAAELGFNLVEQTKTVTAASELARNTATYGGGGIVRLEVLAEGIRRGLRLTFEDQGPGIPDLGLALQDGYTSGGGLGLGLSGSKRLMSEFEIVSRVGEGTRVTVTRWK
jgi:serine/threonine-protein kinase RsbT